MRRTPRFALAVAALLAAMGGAQVASMLQETQTWDEAIHIAAGYSYLKTGDFRINQEHPPLFKLLSAVPLLSLDITLPSDARVQAAQDWARYGDLFLYWNSATASTILYRARMASVVATLALGLGLALWTRRRFGRGAALAALALYALDPNLIAHGRYVTSDIWAAAGLLAAVAAWAHWLETKRRRDLALAGVAIGFALATKFSMAFLPLPLAILYWFRRWQEGRGRLSLRHFVVSAAAAGAIAAGVVALSYGPASVRCFSGPKLQQVVDRSTWVGESMAQVGTRLGLPAHPYLVGLAEVAKHNRAGHQTYLMGELSKTGWWYYFPVVFAVKTPAGTLALLAVVLAAGVAALARRRGWKPQSVPFEWAVLTAPPLIYFGLSMMSHINLGVRHLLPVYPFLFAGLAAAAAKADWRRLALAGAIVTVAVESVAIYPHYLAFFNAPSGGPANGPKILVDSNIDWGQDVKHLRRYMDRHGIGRLCIAYFGRTDLFTYGITDFVEAPATWEKAKRESADCVAAISVTLLYGGYSFEESYQWLREREPMAKVGRSIYLYDLRKTK